VIISGQPAQGLHVGADVDTGSGSIRDEGMGTAQMKARYGEVDKN
jgi:hypothetical protein